MNKVFDDYKFKLCWLDKICAKLFFYRHYKLCKQSGYLDMFWCAISWYHLIMDLGLNPTFWWDEYCSEPVILSISDPDGTLYDRLRFKRGELYELWQDPRTQKTYRFLSGKYHKRMLISRYRNKMIEYVSMDKTRNRKRSLQDGKYLSRN